MKFPFFNNLWHNVGYLFGSLLCACLLLCVAAAAIAVALKFVVWVLPAMF